MTASDKLDSDRRSDQPTAGARRGAVAAVAAAVAVVVLAVLAIVVFGYVPVPRFERAPDVPVTARTGVIALWYSTPETGSCLGLVAASDGALDELRCNASWSGSPHGLVWTRAGELVLVDPELSASSTTRGRVVDTATGELGAAVELSDPPLAPWPTSLADRPDGAQARLESQDGTVRLVMSDPDGVTRTLLEQTGPSDYRLEGVRWSPDGRWLLVVDSRGRLLVADATGRVLPQELVALGRDRWLETAPAWLQPGQPAGRVDVR